MPHCGEQGKGSSEKRLQPPHGRDEAPGDTAPALAAAQNVPSLEAECETRADAGLARECIEGLAEPYRTVSVLYFMQEWPVEAIARQLGRMPKTVHTQLYRAKKMLRRELAAVG